MDRWRQYLFESHSEATLREWANRLRMFRFCRAYGGHANDQDSLVVVYDYRSVTTLHQFFSHLGITLTTLSERPPEPVVGVRYTSAEFAKFPSVVPGTSWIVQPGLCEIAGQQAFASCGGNRVKISLGMDYEITEAHVTAAEAIERALQDAPLPRVDPPVDNDHCICPKFYPDYFETA